MPSLRRIKLFSVLLILIVVTLLFYTSSQRQSRSPDLRTAGDFYDKTLNALRNQNANPKDGGLSKDELVAKKVKESLKEAAQLAKDNAIAKAPKPDPPSEVVGKGSAAQGAERGIAGRKKYGTGEDQKPFKEETAEEHEVELELNSILKKSPSQ
jgi:hypothetical protein